MPAKRKKQAKSGWMLPRDQNIQWTVNPIISSHWILRVAEGGGGCFSILHFNFIFLLKWYPQCYLTQGNTEFDGISSSRNFISEKSCHFCLDQNIASFSRSSSVVYQADCPSAGKQHWLESSGPNQLMIHLSDRQEVASCKAHKTWKDLHRVRVQHWELGLCLIQTINVGLNSKFISSHHSWINLACRS